MTQASNNRLSALSGFPVKDNAMKGLATGNRPGKPAQRLQEILTPQCIVDVCEKTWNGRINLDPCWAQGALTNPLIQYEFPATDGLAAPWIERTFINPPYKDLKAWLAYGRTQPAEQIWLVPVRTHRKWFRRWRDHGIDAYCEMDPIKFVGYDSYFPAPLMLGYRGDDIGRFMTAAQPLGSVYAYQQYAEDTDSNYRSK